MPDKADPLFSVGYPQKRRIKSLAIVFVGDREELIEFPDDNRAFYRASANVEHDKDMNERQFIRYEIWWREDKQ